MPVPVFVEQPSDRSAVSVLEALPYKPFLSSPGFYSIREQGRKRALEILDRFYSDKRVGEMPIEEKTIGVLEDKQWDVVLLWGDCGIGKTWFLNHLLLVRLPQIRKRLRYRPHSGIIDILRKLFPDEILSLHQQLSEILDEVAIGLGTKWRTLLEEKIRNEVAELHPDIPPEMSAFHEAADEYYSYLKDPERLPVYNKLRIEWCQDKGINLLIVIDNLDQLDDAKMLSIYESTRGFLKYENVRVIYSLRTNTRHLRNPFSGLRIEPKYDIQMPQLEFSEVLDRRFNYSMDGNSLSGQLWSFPADTRDWTLPELWQAVKSSRVYSVLLMHLASTDVRTMLDLIRKLVFSPHLRRFEDVSNMESALQCLMLSDNGAFVPEGSPIPNVYDNSTPELEGNALIRARVLEYLYTKSTIAYRHPPASKALNRLGYDRGVVRKVLQLYLENRLVNPSEGFEIERVDETESLRITQLGQYLWDSLVVNPSYLQCVWRGMYISKSCAEEKIEDQNGVQRVTRYITKDGFHRYLQNEERSEESRAHTYNKVHTKPYSAFEPSKLSERIQMAFGSSV